VVLHVAGKGTPVQHALLVALGLDDALEVVERELRVDRHELVDVDHRVDALTRAERVLKPVLVRG
jgi:hypothetical protein